MSQYEKTRVSKGQLGTRDTVKYKEAQMGLMGTKNTKKRRCHAINWLILIKTHYSKPELQITQWRH